MLLTILIFIIILGLLVFVHELGHFVMAKRSGMGVEEFGFGFPPRMFGIKRGETIYSINWIPLGGFVKIVGEDGAGAENPKSFASKGFWPRLATLAAGVVMNFVFAWLLISLGLGLGLPTGFASDSELPDNVRIRDVSVAITEIAPESPAAASDLRIGDRIIQINGEDVTMLDQVQSLTEQYAGTAATYTVLRGDETLHKEITPRVDPPENQGALGIALSNVGLVSYPWYQVLFKGFGTTIDLTWSTLKAFGGIIGGWIGGSGAPVDITGPVGIAKLTGDVAALGFIYLLQFTAILSVNLAIINAVPFPALDGGRILFLILEKLRGRKLPEKAEAIANTVGFALLLTLMVFVTVKDFGRFELISRIKDLF